MLKKPTFQSICKLYAWLFFDFFFHFLLSIWLHNSKDLDTLAIEIVDKHEQIVSLSVIIVLIAWYFSQ